MPEESVRWDALTYDGSAPARQVPTLHLFLKPLERSGEAPAVAQRLFQDIVSRFYSCSPFLAPKEKLAETIRFALGEAIASFGEDALSRVRIGVAVLDPAEGRIHLYRRGDVRIFRSDDGGEILSGEGEDSFPIDAGEGMALLDGPAAEEFARIFQENEEVGAPGGPGRMILAGGTAGIWIPYGTSVVLERESPARSGEEEAVGEPGLRPPEPAGVSSDAPSPPEAGGPNRFSTFPLAILLLLFLVALFWKGEERDEGRSGAVERAEERMPAETAPPSAEERAEEGGRIERQAAAPSPAGTLLWDFRAGAAVTSSPRLTDGLVLVGSRDGYLHALDRRSGEEVWAAEGPEGIGSSPAVGGELAFFGEYGGSLVAVHLATGEEEWRYKTEGRIVSSPLYHEEAVYIGSYDRHLHAVSAATGEPLWRFRTGGVVWSSPAAGEELIAFGSWDGKIYGVDLSTGTEVWSYGTDERIYASPVVRDGFVYVGSFDGSFYKLDAGSGEPAWATRLGGAVQSTAAVSGDVIVVGCEDGSVYSLYDKTGEILWSYPTGGRVPSSPVVDGSVAYIGSYDRFLYALDLDQGHPVWRVDVGASIYSSPALGEEALFVGTNQGRLIALSLGG